MYPPGQALLPNLSHTLEPSITPTSVFTISAYTPLQYSRILAESRTPLSRVPASHLSLFLSHIGPFYQGVGQSLACSCLPPLDTFDLDGFTCLGEEPSVVGRLLPNSAPLATVRVTDCWKDPGSQRVSQDEEPNLCRAGYREGAGRAVPLGRPLIKGWNQTFPALKV